MLAPARHGAFCEQGVSNKSFLRILPLITTPRKCRKFFLTSVILCDIIYSEQVSRTRAKKDAEKNPKAKEVKHMKFINVGFGNMVSVDRIIALANPDSAPIKRLIQDSKDDGRAIDVTCGRRTRAVIVTDSDHVILSAIQTETIANRLDDTDDGIDDEDEDEEE